MQLQKSHKKILVLASLFTAIYFVFSGDHRSLDKDLMELCNNHRISVIYETVELPVSEFFPGGQLKTKGMGRQSDGWFESWVQDTYAIKSRSTDVKGWEGPRRYLFFPRGKIVKFDMEIVRLKDSKLLAKSTTYSRIGGEAAIHSASKSCPSKTKHILNQVFIPAENEKG